MTLTKMVVHAKIEKFSGKTKSDTENSILFLTFANTVQIEGRTIILYWLMPRCSLLSQ